VAPLGLVFLDGPGGPPVLDGLSVRAWPAGREDRTVAATITGAGAAGFHRLPGVTFDPADPFAGSKRPFVVEVSDALNRFQTGRVGAAAPARGVTTVVMRSAPTRAVAPGRIAFWAELWDATNDRPARFALVTVKLADNGTATVATGMADGAGRLLAVGDWPAPKLAAAAAAATRWDAPRTLALTILYDPAAPGDFPRLDQILALTATAWKRRGPDEAFVPPALTVGAPVVFRSQGDPRGRLLITSP
jgi:hypothetical protein